MRRRCWARRSCWPAPTSRAGRARTDLLPERGERALLVGREPAQEALAHAVQMRLAGASEQLAALVRDLGEVAALVLLAAPAAQQAIALHAIDQPGQAAAAEQHAVRE